jgi:acetoacetate decarboxylase
VSADADLLSFTLYVPAGYGGLEGGKIPNVEETQDPRKMFTAYFEAGWGYGGVLSSYGIEDLQKIRRLTMFKFEENKCYMMPAHFGGHDYQPHEDYYRDVLSISYTYSTDGDRLAEYVPEGLELIRPELNVGFCQSREIEWMAGSCYNLIQASVQVRFSGRRDRVEGEFPLVVWENKTTPILTGREQTGVPKIYADIEDLHILQHKCFTNASYEGNTFLRLEMTGIQPADEQLVAQMKAIETNNIGWRYIPKVGGPGADLSQPIFFPQRLEVKSAWTGSGTVRWTELTWEQSPMQWHIIKALAKLPVIEMSPVMMTKGVLVLMASQARVLE